MRYEAFCLMDPHFYDTPTGAQGERIDFDRTRCPAPDGWVRSERGDWVIFSPDGVELPAQGWKIHVSACLDNARDILSDVWDYCVPRRVAFKFLPSEDNLLLANAKYAPRGSSGKFVTIYPADEAQLEVVLHELGTVLAGRPGPYILSDLRWESGPLYVRYGGFAVRTCVSPEGEVVPAIEDGSGRLVPDVRGPAFRVPEWVTLPSFLEPQVAARNNMTVADLPYRIESALHFSNGGGLYTGQDVRTGQRVVLKEARPYAGLTLDGADAVTRQRREREALERLRGLDCVPALLDHFVLGEHHFLVEEFVEGTTLNSLFVDKCPLVHPETDDDDTSAYTAWALDMLDKVERAVAAAHDRGLIIGDLHPDNMLVRPDGRLVLIDFEGAVDASDQRTQRLAAPGFVAPEGLTGIDIDRYALACLRISLFMPLTGLLALDRAKARQLAEEAAREFPVPPGFFDDAVRVIAGEGASAPADSGTPQRLEPDHQGWTRARDSMTAAILAAATPDRDDRLFPGDPEQFAAPGGGLNLAHGAAGVLYALDAVGAGRNPGHEEWLVRHALNPESGTRLGFYDGLHGIAYVLDHFGHREEAMKLLDMCLGEQWQQLGLGLEGGLAGIGLNLQHFAETTGDLALRDAAFSVAGIVADRLGLSGGAAEGDDEDQYTGLLRGSTGPALMFLRLYEYSGDPEFLDLAGAALRQDLARCVLRESGALEVDEGWRTLPYLGIGSAGIGLVLDDYLAHREDDQFRGASAAIRTAATERFFIQAGLFQGMAGLILFLSRPHPPGTAAERDPVVAAHIRRLSRHALSYQGHLAFPGEMLMRLSTDLATGSAGVLLAVGSALHNSPVRLPFLAPATDGTRRTAHTSLSPRGHERR
ncbi:class III lanthionine synthetase LanKC [Streptomyces sp. ISL-100]|uniref:class III lanthionine synthetase LanKC n=1 Tax=Streptomyces sp. ISL-100 TaxID=2819173 RepID=UPI002035FFE8|nr:class III lanthionine synthetase LanKC [Streptomyces sp. ISL-100]